MITLQEAIEKSPRFWWEGDKFDSRDLSTGQNTHCDTEIKKRSNKFAFIICYCLWERKRVPTIPFVLEQYLYREQYKKEAMYQFKKTDTKFEQRG